MVDWIVDNMKKEYKEIKYIVETIVEDSEETRLYGEAEKALTAYRILGQIIKDHLVGDIVGTDYTREFKLCRGRLKIGVIYEPTHKV